MALLLFPTVSGAGEPRAPTFVLRDLEGKTFKMADQRGRPVVLDFWATWCRPCRASMPHLSTVQERYRDDGLVVLGLSVDDLEPVVVRRFTQRLGVTFRVAIASQEVLDLYGPIRLIPTTLFIDRQGHVVRRVIGYIDAETMDTYASELLAPPPPRTEGKP